MPLDCIENSAESSVFLAAGLDYSVHSQNSLQCRENLETNYGLADSQAGENAEAKKFIFSNFLSGLLSEVFACENAC